MQQNIFVLLVCLLVRLLVSSTSDADRLEQSDPNRTLWLKPRQWPQREETSATTFVGLVVGWLVGQSVGLSSLTFPPCFLVVVSLCFTGYQVRIPFCFVCLFVFDCSFTFTTTTTATLHRKPAQRALHVYPKIHTSISIHSAATAEL